MDLIAKVEIRQKRKKERVKEKERERGIEGAVKPAVIESD